MLLDLWKRYRLKQIASINPFLLPGPWTLRNGRHALPLPVQHGLHAPQGAFLRSWIDRGDGWRPYDLDHLPDRIEGPGWWGDPGLWSRTPLRPLITKAYRKWRLGGFQAQVARPAPPLPRPPRLTATPLVSILIPTDGKVVAGLRGPQDLVADCVRSIREKTTYPNYEILVAHNGRVNPEVPSLHYVSPGPFNLAHKWNWLIAQAKGEYLVLLNDDTVVIEPDWIQNLLEFAVQPDVGVVGPKLLFPDGRIQHAGIVFGLATLCGHVFMGHPHDCPGTAHPREFSAVTAGCLMIKRGWTLDEGLPGTFDVDLCLRARKAGLKVIYTPHSSLFHLESVTFRLGGRTYWEELKRFRGKWPDCIPDPFYTPDTPPCRH